MEEEIGWGRNLKRTEKSLELFSEVKVLMCEWIPLCTSQEKVDSDTSTLYKSRGWLFYL